MSSFPNSKHDVHFGQINSPPGDWREEAPDDDRDPDDEEMAETPADVIEVLGFDPLDFKES